MTEADHSLDRTTASRPSSTAATTAAAVMTAVIGTCPLRKPNSAERGNWGSIFARDAAHGQPRDGGRLFNGGEAVARRVDDAERGVVVVSGDALTVTME